MLRVVGLLQRGQFLGSGFGSHMAGRLPAWHASASPRRAPPAQSVPGTAPGPCPFSVPSFTRRNFHPLQQHHTHAQGWTALHSAVSCGHEAVAQVLLAAGACARQKTAQGRTALHYAASKGAAGVVEELVRHGAEVDARDCTGSTALHRAAGTGHVAVLRILAERCGAALDVKDGQGHTPLAVACVSGHPAAARYLAGRGADVEAEDREGETPLSLAVRAGPGLRQDLADLALKRKTLADFELDDEVA